MNMTRLCPWGCGEIGHHDHIFWQCAGRPYPRPERPKDARQRRLAWPVEDNAERNAQVIHFMEMVVKEVWNKRYET